MDESEFKVECITPERKGMQAGLPPSRVRVTHLPTKLAAECTSRSQHRARNICFLMLESALTDPDNSRYL